MTPRPPAPRIDFHAHYYGGALPAFLTSRDSRPCLRMRDGKQMMWAMNGEFPFTPAHHDPAVGLAEMDRMCITTRVLTFPGALCVDALPADQVAGPIAAFNDHLADLRAQTDGRLTGLAGLPLADIDLAVAELIRVRRVLRLPGVILPADYFSTRDDMAPLAPLFAAADATGCHIMVHPGPKAGGVPAPLSPDLPQYRTSAVALQSQTADVVLTLILSDVLDRWPGISWQVVNLGGTVPFILERMDSIARHRNPDDPFPTDRLRRLWYDCASLGPRALELAVRVYGADRILMGSDFPIFRDDPYAHALAPADLSQCQRAMIEGGNAAALLARCDAVV